MSFFEVLLLLLSIVALVVVALLAVLAAVRITTIVGYGSDSDLQTAHRYLTWASIVAWISVFIIVLLLAFYVSRLDSGEGALFSGEIWVRVLIFVIFALAVALSVLIFLALTDINKSSLSSRASTLNIQTLTGWAGGISLATAFAILVAFLLALYDKSRKDIADKTTAAKAETPTKEAPRQEEPESFSESPFSESAINPEELETLVAENPELLLAA